MKDNFSVQSDAYLKFRPGYPPELFDFLNSITFKKRVAWDCGTGNGQIAMVLSKTFERVFATDISRSQLSNAYHNKNIIYSLQPAEKTNFETDKFDLIVVGQAIHWFDFDKFYSEVKRTAKKQAIICIIGYGLIEISEEIDLIIRDFFEITTGPYWDKERKYLDKKYKTIPFPFDELPSPSIVNKVQWSLTDLMGYLNTWSAVQHFIAEKGFNPTEKMKVTLERAWGTPGKREVRFPIYIRTGRVA